MNTATRRATIYFDPALFLALRLKAVESEHSMSELVNEAVRMSLDEDRLDLQAFETRAKEPVSAFSDVLKKLKRDGKI